MSLPRQPSGEVIVLDSEGGSQASPLPAEGANGTAESMVSSHSSKTSSEALQILWHAWYHSNQQTCKKGSKLVVAQPSILEDSRNALDLGKV